MSFEEEFDSIIRRKAEQESYPFEESNWDKINSLLNAERKATRALKINKLLMPAALVIVIGSIGVFTFGYLGDKNTSADLVSEVSNPVSNPVLLNIENSHIQPNKNENNTTLNNVNSNAAKPATASANIDLKKVQAQRQLKNVGQLASSNSKTELTKMSRPEEKKSISQMEKVAESRVKSPTTLNKNKVVNMSARQTVDTKQPFNSNNLEEAVSNLADASLKATGTTEKDGSQNGIQKPEETKETSIATSVLSAEENKKTELNPTNSSLQTPTEEVLSADDLSAVYSALPFEVMDMELMQTPFHYLQRYDDYYGKKSKKHYMNVELGPDYLLGWNAKKGKDGKGMNWFAGVNYGLYLTNKVSISFGLQAYNIANINQPFYLAVSKEYGFGSKNIYTRVTSNQLYYAALPLKLNYAVNSTNSIGFGVNAAYLIGSSNTVSKYYLQDNEEKSIASSTSHDKGVYKGTSMVNVLLTAHYKTQFCKRLGLNLEFTYGLTDIFENTEAVKTSEKPIGVRLGLSYTLFDK